MAAVCWLHPHFQLTQLDIFSFVCPTSIFKVQIVVVVCCIWTPPPHKWCYLTQVLIPKAEEQFPAISRPSHIIPSMETLTDHSRLLANSLMKGWLVNTDVPYISERQFYSFLSPLFHQAHLAKITFYIPCLSATAYACRKPESMAYKDRACACRTELCGLAELCLMFLLEQFLLFGFKSDLSLQQWELLWKQQTKFQLCALHSSSFDSCFLYCNK